MMDKQPSAAAQALADRLCQLPEHAFTDGRVADLIDLFAAAAVAAAGDPELDATDGAHPAWWRGCDHGVERERARCLKILHEEGWVGRAEQRIAHTEIDSAERAKPAPLWRHPSRWRHRGRGTSYNVLTRAAEAQCTTGPINEGDHVSVYWGDDDNWYVRKTAEFDDGQFERIDITEGWPQLAPVSLGWKCRAQATADPPLDCNWPWCGCDPHADKVLSAVEESGRYIEHAKPDASDEQRAAQLMEQLPWPTDWPAHGKVHYYPLIVTILTSARQSGEIAGMEKMRERAAQYLEDTAASYRGVSSPYAVALLGALLNARDAIRDLPVTPDGAADG